jgi:SAM-dependent methyltransferase
MPAPASYDDAYYEESLARGHWFKDNAAKHELRWRQVLAMVDPQPSDVVLEIGCAAGRHALRIAPLCRRVVGVDAAAAAIVRARAAAQASPARERCEFVEADAARLDFLADASVDKAMAIDFVEHVADDDLLAILREVRRVLRPGGTLSVFTPCATHYVERLKARNLLLKQLPGHVAVRGLGSYRPLLAQAGLPVERTWHSPSTYPVFGLLDRLLAGAPLVGPLFRFRLCFVARRAQ